MSDNVPAWQKQAIIAFVLGVMTVVIVVLIVG